MLSRSLTSLIALLVTSLPASLNAQEASPGDTSTSDTSDEVIIVVGQKDKRTLLDTQASVGVVTDEDIREKDLTTFRESFRTLANVIDADFVDAGFVIRGVNSEGLTPGGAPLAAIYVDGAEQSGQGARRGARGLWDVEQVEVYRGPQSTISGRAALAGAIYVTTNSAEYEYDAAARISYGELDSFDAALAGGGAIIDDILAFRVAAEYQRRDSEVHYPSYSEFDLFDRLVEDEYYQLRGKLRIDPAPDLRVDLTYSYSYDTPAYDDVAGPGFGFDFSDRRGDFNLPFFQEAREADSQTAIARVEYDVSADLTLTSLTSQNDVFVDRSSVNAGTPGEQFTTEGGIDERLFTQELRLNYDGPTGLRGVLGLFYAFDRSDSFFDRSVFFGGGRADSTRTLSENRNYAIFGETTVPVLDRVDLIVGARLDRNEREIDSFFARDNFDPDAADTETSDFVESAETVFLPKVGLDVALSDQLRAGITYQRGYRPGGAARNIASGDISEFDAEFTDTVEASLRKRFGARSTVALNVFYTDWTDQQVEFDLDPDDFFSRITVNAGQSRLFGGELEADYSFSRDLSAFASIGVVETEFEDFVVAGLGDFSGLEFPEAPNFNAAFGVDYRPVIGFFAGADAKYVGSYLARDLQNAPVDIVGDYFVANARVGYAFENASVMLFADNLFNEQYFVYRDRIGDFDCCATFGRSRIVGVTADMRF